jgi:hypothetical protein
MSRLEGSRWRLRWAREMRPAMEFEWVFFRLLFEAKRECRHFQGCGEETQIPPHNVADYLTRSVRRASGFVLDGYTEGDGGKKCSKMNERLLTFTYGQRKNEVYRHGWQHAMVTASQATKSKELLDSWKEIAVFLNRGVRTVQRWERAEDLPIHRHPHRSGSSVFAFASEIRSWLNTRGDSKDARHRDDEQKVDKIAFRNRKVSSEELVRSCETARIRAQRVRGEFQLPEHAEQERRRSDAAAIWNLMHQKHAPVRRGLRFRTKGRSSHGGHQLAS